MNVIVATTKKYEINVLKQLVDNLVSANPNSFVLLANLNDLSVNIICKTNVTNDNLNCGEIMRDICTKCHGNGGGNKLFAQGGGSDASHIDDYLKEVKEKLSQL